MEPLNREASGWVLARVWLDALEKGARDFFGTRPRMFAERGYEYASEAFLRILENDYGVKAAKASTIKEAVENYIDVGIQGGLFYDRSQFVLKEVTVNRLEINVLKCPYLNSCQDLLNGGLMVSNLTCARIGCFKAVVKLLADIDCTYRVNAFNTEDGCQGVILKK